VYRYEFLFNLSLSLSFQLKTESGSGGWDAELDEEFEDKAGNVMNRKTFTDLARQGLLD